MTAVPKLIDETAHMSKTERTSIQQIASFRVAQDDLVQGALLCARANSRVQRLIRRRTVAGCALLAAAAIVLFLAGQPIASVIAWTLVAGIPIAALVAPRVFRFHLKRTLRQLIGSGARPSDQQWLFSAEGIRQTSGQMATDIRWTAVRRLLASTTHLALLNAANAALATIPRRAFVDAASEAKFRAAVERFSGCRFEDVAP